LKGKNAKKGKRRNIYPVSEEGLLYNALQGEKEKGGTICAYRKSRVPLGRVTPDLHEYDKQTARRRRIASPLHRE